MLDTFIWRSEVQQHDLDVQHIVNNAVYLQYFDQARRQLLSSKGIDLEAWHKKGIDIVLYHVDMTIRHSLKLHDQFYVKSTYERVGKLRVVFEQSIYKMNDDKLIANAKTTLTCVSTHTGKPVMPDEILTFLSMNES